MARLTEIAWKLSDKGADFETLREEAISLNPDFRWATAWDIILPETEIQCTVAFPFTSVSGHTRMHHFGYRGTQELFDRV